MSKVADHLHRYKKVNLGTDGKKYEVYRCQKPACSHYISLTLAEGKLCECNRCHEPMIIGKVQLNGSSGRAMSRPHCNECVQKKRDKNAEAIAAYIAGTTVKD